MAISTLNREDHVRPEPLRLRWRITVAVLRGLCQGACVERFPGLPSGIPSTTYAPSPRDLRGHLTAPAGSIHTFTERFSRSETSKADVLLGVQNRVTQFRELTLEAIQLAIYCRLLTVIPSSAKLVAHEFREA